MRGPLREGRGARVTREVPLYVAFLEADPAHCSQPCSLHLQVAAVSSLLMQQSGPGLATGDDQALPGKAEPAVSSGSAPVTLFYRSMTPAA